MRRPLPTESEARQILAQRRTRPAPRPPPPAGRSLAPLIKKLDAQFGRGASALEPRWVEIVGERLARLTRPQKLTNGRGNAGGTLELRVADSCTRLDDTLAITALYRCLVRHLARKPGLNADLTAASRALAGENIWRAQRYGLHGGFVCERRRAMLPVGQGLDEVLEVLDEDAAALGCGLDLAHCRTIVAGGTSADMQLAVFEEARAGAGGQSAGLVAVTDWIAAQTRADDDGLVPKGASLLRGAA